MVKKHKERYQPGISIMAFIHTYTKPDLTRAVTSMQRQDLCPGAKTQRHLGNPPLSFLRPLVAYMWSHCKKLGGKKKVLVLRLFGGVFSSKLTVGVPMIFQILCTDGMISN